MRFSLRLLVAALVVPLCVGCGGQGGGSAGATTDTPSGTIILFIDALEGGDIEAYMALLPEKDRLRAETSRQVAGEQFDKTMKSAMQSMERAVAGGKVVGEEISGNRATVRIKNREGVEVTWKCVKEPDGWKIAVGN
jgi:hypothetical protein